MKSVFYFVCAAVSLSLAFTSCDKDDVNDDGEKTVLEGKWEHSERTDYENDGYADQVESFTFSGNKFVLESTETGVNPYGESWGYGHKLLGTFTCTESSFTIKIEKFYAFNNDDKQFDWHEYEESSVGQSYTFNYQIENGHSLGVTAPSEFALGGGSYLGTDQVWYTKK